MKDKYDSVISRQNLFTKDRVRAKMELIFNPNCLFFKQNHRQTKIRKGEIKKADFGDFIFPYNPHPSNMLNVRSFRQY